MNALAKIESDFKMNDLTGAGAHMISTEQSTNKHANLSKMGLILPILATRALLLSIWGPVGHVPNPNVPEILVWPDIPQTISINKVWANKLTPSQPQRCIESNIRLFHFRSPASKKAIKLTGRSHFSTQIFSTTTWPCYIISYWVTPPISRFETNRSSWNSSWPWACLPS